MATSLACYWTPESRHTPSQSELGHRYWVIERSPARLAVSHFDNRPDVALTAIPITSAQAAGSAKPADPNGYGERVRFGATEDHDIYPGPGNVVGGFRHDAARNSDGPGVAAEVKVSAKEPAARLIPPARTDILRGQPRRSE